MRYFILALVLFTIIAIAARPEKKPAPQNLPRFLVVVDFSKSGLCMCNDTVTILRVVRRAFAPFPNIRITTNPAEPFQPYGYKQNVIVTNQVASTSEAGFAHLGSIWYGTWTDMPAYVYSGKLSISRIAGTLVHEIGHTIGLRHQSTWSTDCRLTATYAPGAWMGFPDSTSRWVSGKTNEGCNVLQNDSLMLAAYLR